MPISNGDSFSQSGGTASGATPKVLTALTNTVVAIKTTPGTLWAFMAYNPSAATVYLQFFDLAVGSVTLGTTPPTWVIAIPAGSASNLVPQALHSNAISVAATTTATGSTAPGTAALLSVTSF